MPASNNIIQFPKESLSEEELQSGCCHFISVELEKFFAQPDWQKDFIFLLGAIRGVVSAKRSRTDFHNQPAA